MAYPSAFSCSIGRFGVSYLIMIEHHAKNENWDEMSFHEARFEAFASRYLTEHPEAMLRLKREHTHKVLSHARTIVHEGSFTPEEGRATLVAALYHDVGRFPQYVRWRTFSDAQSENHALLSVHVVRNERFLETESSFIRGAVLAAIALHNRYRLPRALRASYLKIVSAVRDADKLDIMRIMAFHLSRPIPTGDVVLHVRDEPSKWTPDLVEKVLAGGVPGYHELIYINDFRILIGSWLHDLHFASSRRLCAKSGHIEAILEGLPPAKELEPVHHYIRALLHDGEGENG